MPNSHHNQPDKLDRSPNLVRQFRNILQSCCQGFVLLSLGLLFGQASVAGESWLRNEGEAAAAAAAGIETVLPPSLLRLRSLSSSCLLKFVSGWPKSRAPNSLS